MMHDAFLIFHCHFIIKALISVSYNSFFSTFLRSDIDHIDRLSRVELYEVAFERPSDHTNQDESEEEVGDRFDFHSAIFELGLVEVETGRVEEHDKDDEVQQSGQSTDKAFDFKIESADSWRGKVAEGPEKRKGCIQNQVTKPDQYPSVLVECIPSE